MINKAKKHKRKAARRLNRIGLFIIVLAIIACLFGSRFYRYINAPNVDITKAKSEYIYIPNGTSFADLKIILEKNGAVKDLNSFEWVASKKEYIDNVKGGRYKLINEMSNNQLVNLLRSGKQAPVNVTFNNIRTIKQLCGVVSKTIMADSTELYSLLNNCDYINHLGFTQQTIPAMFIPNTYELYWNTDAKSFLKRMKREYDNFWTEDKRSLAEKTNLTLVEISTLASIVDEESHKNKEKPTIAGLYLNRIRKGIPLQADPTLKFALGNFEIKRLLNADMKIDSPYNTYMYKGLPPGPIRIPSIAGINAVLKAEKHSYLYMCAKEDFSGYHNFAKTLAQHNNNAAKYRRELNKRGIKR